MKNFGSRDRKMPDGEAYSGRASPIYMKMVIQILCIFPSNKYEGLGEDGRAHRKEFSESWRGR